MKFGIIDPRSARAEIIDAPDVWAAGKEVGLELGKTDNGLLARADRSGGIAYFCYEYAFFVPSDRQRYFIIGRRLFAGGVVLYAFDGEGATMDLEEMPPIIFYGNTEQVQKAIADDLIERPVMKINNVQFWQWPDPPPDADIAARMREHGTL